jgi:hypothetical protein
MPHVSLNRLHKVGDQVVTPLELDLDLGERVVDSVSQGDQAIENANGVHQQADGNDN